MHIPLGVCSPGVRPPLSEPKGDGVGDGVFGWHSGRVGSLMQFLTNSGGRVGSNPRTAEGTGVSVGFGTIPNGSVGEVSGVRIC